ncbi:MAG TPA: aldehyde dehydrogenase family protein, partial [Bryobacteraceae bacterium]
MAIATVNPATGEVLKTFEPLSNAQIEAKLQLAADTFPRFQRLSFAARAGMMNKAAEILERDKDALGRLMTLEMGKTFRSAVDEAVKCAWACRYYAENASSYLADEEVSTNARHSYVKYQPMGVVLAIMPWNFPLWQVFRFIAPGLMAGNVGLLKHASNVPQCALKIEEILIEAGFPAGAFQTLLIGAKQVDAVLSDARVAAATLTGSEGAGVEVGVSAAKRV